MNKEEIEEAIHIVASLPYKPWIEINEEEKKAIEIVTNLADKYDKH